MEGWQLLSALKANTNTRSQCFYCWTANTVLPQCKWNPSPHLCNMSALQSSSPGEDRITGQPCSPCMGTLLSSTTSWGRNTASMEQNQECNLNRFYTSTSGIKLHLECNFQPLYTQKPGFKYIHRAQQRFQFRPSLSWHELRFFSYMILILL